MESHGSVELVVEWHTFVEIPSMQFAAAKLLLSSDDMYAAKRVSDGYDGGSEGGGDRGGDGAGSDGATQFGSQRR